MGLKESNFIQACYGHNDEQIPVWIMRQAGRYLPEYRAIREKVSFEELCRSPRLIAEVVRQPIERFGLDAAILFSDIMTIVPPMGLSVSFATGGPKITTPIRTPEDVEKLSEFDVRDKLHFVVEGIRAIKKELPTTPLIGFAGSPFTLACYMIQGGGSSDFPLAKQFLYTYPKAGEKLLDIISAVTTEYLAAQIEAGADAVQLFDSWGGILSQNDYRRWSQRTINKVFGSLDSSRAPRILFVNNLAPYISHVNDIDCEVVGVDYRMDLRQAMDALPGKAIQGNLEPAALFGSAEEITRTTRDILEAVVTPERLIFNLGHGIKPKTPVESVATLVEVVHSFRTCKSKVGAA